MSEWIRVEDGLPESFADVLGWFPSRIDPTQGWCSVVAYNKPMKMEAYWEEQDGSACKQPPTHWMRLPSQPNEAHRES